MEDKPEYGKVYSLYDLAKHKSWKAAEVFPEPLIEPVARRDYKAEQEARDRALKEAKAKLIAEHPDLIVGMDLTIAAKNIRIELKREWPSVKFSVKTKRFSMGDSIDVYWTDGPTSKEVKKIIDKYQDGDFDGMTDCYNYRGNAWTETFGGGKYVTPSRSYSDRLIIRAINALAAEYGIKDIPEVEDYKQGRAYGSPFNNTGDRWNRNDEWQHLINVKCSELSE